MPAFASCLARYINKSVQDSGVRNPNYKAMNNMLIDYTFAVKEMQQFLIDHTRFILDIIEESKAQEGRFLFYWPTIDWNDIVSQLHFPERRMNQARMAKVADAMPDV